MTPSLSLLPRLLTALTLVAVAASFAEEKTKPAFLPGQLEDASGKKMDSAELAGKYIGLYFSASWCAPCRAFTPKLREFRDAHVARGFEVVLVNFDRTNTEKRRYIRDSGMEWPSVPGARRKASNQLAETYRVEGYPTLLILDPDGNLVTDQGVEAILNEADTVFTKWLNLRNPDA